MPRGGGGEKNMNDSAGRRGGAVVSEKSPMVPEENKVGYGGVGVVGIEHRLDTRVVDPVAEPFQLLGGVAEITFKAVECLDGEGDIRLRGMAANPGSHLLRGLFIDVCQQDARALFGKDAGDARPEAGAASARSPAGSGRCGSRTARLADGTGTGARQAGSRCSGRAGQGAGREGAVQQAQAGEARRSGR